MNIASPNVTVTGVAIKVGTEVHLSTTSVAGVNEQYFSMYKITKSDQGRAYISTWTWKTDSRCAYSRPVCKSKLTMADQALGDTLKIDGAT